MTSCLLASLPCCLLVASLFSSLLFHFLLKKHHTVEVREGCTGHLYTGIDIRHKTASTFCIFHQHWNSWQPIFSFDALVCGQRPFYVFCILKCICESFFPPLHVLICKRALFRMFCKTTFKALVQSQRLD